MYARLLVIVLAAAGLGGCAFGQKFDYAGGTVPIRKVNAGYSTALVVLDQREVVTKGSKPESFVGLSRGGFGNPFDVNTKSGSPLATEMSTAIAGALRAKGLTVKTVTVRPSDGPERARQLLVSTGSSRSLLFILNQWRTDSMARTGLDYDVTLDVLDESGKGLAQSRVSGKEVAGSSILSAEKDAQAWFSEKVAELLHDSAVERALE